MCSRTTCPQCKKPTYAGCGMHVEQVLGSVPEAERCKCREEARKKQQAEPRAEHSFWPFSR